MRKMKIVLIKLVKAYQRFISPLSAPRCRFYPTCSNYFLQVVEKYGAIKGSMLGIKRILRCHPFSKGGYDPLK